MNREPALNETPVLVQALNTRNHEILLAGETGIPLLIGL